MKRLIINADDLGLSPGVDKGIFSSVEAGSVRSLSALTGGPDFKNAIDRAGSLEGVGIGIHLNLTGVWDSTKTPAPPGFFRTRPSTLLRLCLSGRADLGFARACIKRQIEAFLDTGIQPTHIDGHHHVHIFPGIAGIAADLEKEYGIQRARMPVEGWSAYCAGNGFLVKRLLVRILSSKAKKVYGSREIRFPDRFFGFGLMDRPDFKERLIKVLSRIGHGISEIMVHPGSKEEGFDLDPYSDGRAIETAVLTAPGTKEAIRNLGITLVSFSEL